MKTALLRFARTAAGGLLIRLIVSNAPALLPVRRLQAGPDVMAFYHPVPSYPVHILIIPLPVVQRLQGTWPDSGRLLVSVLRAAGVIVEQLDLESGWQLVVNGGAYQDVAVLHFHLINGNNI